MIRRPPRSTLFPYRRSSDLSLPALTPSRLAVAATLGASWRSAFIRRSEEHTSELQSRSDLVCRLLLEKKKTAQFGMTAMTEHVCHKYRYRCKIDVALVDA